MTHYEKLQDKAYKEGLTVKEKPLQTNDGRITGSRIAIRENLCTNKEKSCVLAEELGHHYTTTGDIMDQTVPENRKQERRARIWAYDHMIGLTGIIKAYESGCRNRSEAAACLEVTEKFLQEAVNCYQEKYGIAMRLDNYIIYFAPALRVMKVDG